MSGKPLQFSLLSDATLQKSGRSGLFSAAAHVLVALALLGAFARHSRLKPTDMPGIAHGSHIMLSYDAGGPPPASPAVPTPPKPSLLATKAPLTAPKPAPTTPSTTDSISGIGASGDSSLGDADIHIALLQFHPCPTPDLSTLPSGGGDIVLDAVIDAQGHIAQLTVEHSLGAAIDQTVLATVEHWTFSPATHDGVPTATEQEILFHYQRG